MTEISTDATVAHCIIIILFNVARGSRKGSGGTLLASARMWSSMGDIIEGGDETDEKRKVDIALSPYQLQLLYDIQKKGRGSNLLRRLSMRKDRRKAYMSEIYESDDSYR